MAETNPENRRKENERKFEVLLYLQLTSAALEECFDIINEGKYNNEVNKILNNLDFS